MSLAVTLPLPFLPGNPAARSASASASDRAYCPQNVSICIPLASRITSFVWVASRRFIIVFSTLKKLGRLLRVQWVIGDVFCNTSRQANPPPPPVLVCSRLLVVPVLLSQSIAHRPLQGVPLGFAFYGPLTPPHFTQALHPIPLRQTCPPVPAGTNMSPDFFPHSACLWLSHFLG